MTVMVAVIDIGKTNTRLSLVDEALQTRHHASLASAVADGIYPCYPVDDIYSWLIAELKSLSSRHSINSIVAITHGAAMALTDGRELVLSVMDYEFTGPEKYSTEYDRKAADFSSTGSPRLPAGLNLGRQLYWQQKEYPQEFERATCWLLYPQYWAWRLSGIPSTEVSSLGCHTDLWNVKENGFSEFTKQQGWDSHFPPLKKAWDTLGNISPEVAEQTGISPDCLIYCGVHDSNASFMLQRRVLHQDFVLISTGTWLVGMSSSKNKKELNEYRDTLYFTSAWGKAIPSFRFAAGKEFAEIAGADGLLENASPGDIQALVNTGIYAYPAFSGLGGPFSDSPGRLSKAVRDPLSRAALATLYCALMTDYCLELTGVGGDLVIEGPFANNAVYCELLASLMPARNILIAPFDNSIISAGVFLCTHKLAGWSKAKYTHVKAITIIGLDDYRQSWRAACDAL